MQFDIPDGTPSPERGNGPCLVTWPSMKGPEFLRFVNHKTMMAWLSGFTFNGEKEVTIPHETFGNVVQVS